MSKTIIIVGGSIAGMAMARLLERLGFNVTILEKSSGVAHQGSGITMPVDLVNRCIELDLFDKDIPRLIATSRSFMRKEAEHLPTTFWVQPINALTINWLHVYENLRKCFNKDTYLPNTFVKNIYKYDEKFYVETYQGQTYTADVVIAADGVDSSIREVFFPTAKPNYAGYVAWRGVVAYDKAFNLHEKIHYSVFPGGHLLMYQIPSRDGTGELSLNWVLYEDRQHEPLSELLIDRHGHSHSRSLPIGFLSEKHISQLHRLAKRVLAPLHAQLIIDTPQPFIQAIFDLQLPLQQHSSIFLTGDAAGTLRPHTGSGVVKAIMGAISLFELLQEKPEASFEEVASHWQNAQHILTQEESKKSMAIGNAMVTKCPDWHELNQKSAGQWWNSVMEGKSWYITPRQEPISS